MSTKVRNLWRDFYHDRSLTRLCIRVIARAKVPVKGRLYCHEQPLFRQVGNLGRTTANDLFSIRSGVTYLVVRVSRAKVMTYFICISYDYIPVAHVDSI